MKKKTSRFMSKRAVLITSGATLIASITIAATGLTGLLNTKPAFVLEIPDKPNVNLVDTSFVSSLTPDETEGNGSVYEFKNNTDAITLGAKLARVFELTGDYEDKWYSTEKAGAPDFLRLEDGSQMVDVNLTGTLSFQYSNGDAWVAPKCRREGPIPGECVDFDEELSNYPSDATARDQAHALYSKLGLEVQPSRIRIIREMTSLSAQAPVMVDGRATGIFWNIFWGNTGKIDTVSGWAADPLKVSGVETVSEKDALARLSAEQWYLSATPQKTGVLTITRIERTSTMAFDANGKMWSVPSFTMTAKGETTQLVILALKHVVKKLAEPLPGDGN